MINLNYRKYSEVRNEIREGDFLFKRGRGKPSPFIRYFTRSYYTHIMAATWKWSHHPEDDSFTKDILECVEFREGYGSRTTNLSEYLKKDSGLIDVFRLPEKIQVFDVNTPEGYWVSFDALLFTNNMRRATGCDYGWKTIFRLWMFGTPARMFMPQVYDDNLISSHNVCSSSISHFLRKDFIDLVQFRADDFTTPSDLAQSPITNYLWTLIDE